MKRLAFPIAGLCLGLCASAAPAQVTPAAVEDVRQYLSRLEKLGFAGAVAVTQAGRPLIAEGYGLADRERGVPWSPETVSTIGSITKQFTGAAILALVEEGALSVDDPITDYFPDVPADKRDITLYDLLTHSSGIVDLRGAGDWDAIDRDAFIRRAMEQDLAFEPKSAYAYSNAGFSLLGAVIEQVTGKSWESYVRERLLIPSEMTETGYILADWEDGQLAQGYRAGERWGTVLERPMAEDGPYWVLRANGGIYSNAWDMVRWGEALMRGQPLSPESMATYWSPHFDEGGGDSYYGYGWVVMDLGGKKVITHNGGNGILFADMAIVPEDELVMFIQTNVVADFRMAGLLLEQIGGRLLLGADLPEVPDRAAEPPADPDALTGRYVLPSGGAVRVTRLGDELAVEAEDPEGFRSLLSTREVNVERATRLTDRTEALVAAYLAGDWTPLWEAYGRPDTFEDWSGRAQRRIDQLAAENGPLVGHVVLGTAFRPGRDVTLVRIDFERGEEYRAYVWNAFRREELMGTSARGLDHVLHVLPQTDGTYATWDGRTGESRPVSFVRDGDRIALRIGRLEANRRP